MGQLVSPETFLVIVAVFIIAVMAGAWVSMSLHRWFTAWRSASTRTARPPGSVVHRHSGIDYPSVEDCPECARQTRQRRAFARRRR